MRRSIYAIPRLIVSQVSHCRLPALDLTAVQKSVRSIALPLLVPLALVLGSCENQAYDSLDIAPAQDAVNTAQTSSSQLKITYPEMSSENNSAFIQVAENNLTVAQVGVQDIVGSTLNYRLQDGEDMNKFTIDKHTGTLSFKEVPDWEKPTDADSNNNYMVQWQVLSSTGKARSQFLVVQVTDIPE